MAGIRYIGPIQYALTYLENKPMLKEFYTFFNFSLKPSEESNRTFFKLN